MRWIVFMAAVVAASGPLAAWAQQPAQLHAGLQERKIKALSDQQIADLEAGRDMGLATAAELNGYPGPTHTLELADKLGLSADQKDSVKKLFDSMKDEAVRLGERLLDAEADLDRDFASGAITEDQLTAEVKAIATLQGELRLTHLKYHLVVAQLLTPEQVARYDELRGYADHAATSLAPSPKHMHQH